ncbi:MAG: alpha/beta fold hydrolase [Anaerolineales bacterium]|nr:alpha/beta fold hydrolase [Anaerolineales bacterium]
MDKISINGIELAYVRRGRGAPLVLLHGYPLDHHIWDGVLPMLEDKFDLILPDLRGFGDSTTVDAPYAMNDFASDVAGLLDHLEIQKAAIAGHSMGGYVALAFLNRYPGRVSGFGMVSSQVLADTPERKEGRYKTAAEIAEKGVQGVVESMASKLTPDERVRMLAGEIMKRQKPAGFVGALKAMAERMDAASLLTSFKFPVAIVHGDSDDLIPVERAREMKGMVPHAHFLELKGVGHLPMMEAPRETAGALSMLG